MALSGACGVIVVDKPEGWTSHDVVSKMRGIAGTRRVGHLGTLDPIATGVLPLMIGQATRLAQFWDGSEKVYEAVVRFGFATSTYDRAGEPVGTGGRTAASRPIRSRRVSRRCAARSSRLRRRFPRKRSTACPRTNWRGRNMPVDLAPVRVSIYELTLLDIEGVSARLRVRCSAGTYIRSIAHQLGDFAWLRGAC